MNRIFFRIFASAFLLSACAPEVFASTNGTANAVSGKQKFGRIKDETYIVTNGYTRAEIDSKIPQVVEGSLSPYGTNAVKTALGSYVTKSVTNEVAGQVRSLETSKQDALPYPTNAIPPSAISNPPWQMKLADYTTTNAVQDIVEDYGYATPGVAGAIATNVVGEKVAPWAMAGNERLPDNVLTLTNNTVKTVGGTSALPKQIDAVSASEFAKPWRKWGGYQALQTVSYGGKLWVCALNHSGEEVFNEQGHWIDLVSRIDTDRSWLHWRDMWIDNNYAPRNGDVSFGMVTASSVYGNLNGSVTVGSGKTLSVQNGSTFTIGGSNFNTVVDRAIDAKVTSATNAVAGKIHRITATNGVSAIDGDLSIFDKKGCDYTAQNASFYYSIHWDEGGNPYWTASYSGASLNYNFRIRHVSGTTWHVVCPELSIDEYKYNVGALWDNTLSLGPVYGGVLTKCAVRTPTRHGSVVSSALKINGIPLTNDITIAGTNAKDVNDLIANYVKTNSATTNLTVRIASRTTTNDVNAIIASSNLCTVAAAHAMTNDPHVARFFDISQEVPLLYASVTYADVAGSAPASSANWEDVYNTPTTLSGYGITDGLQGYSIGEVTYCIGTPETTYQSAFHCGSVYVPAWGQITSGFGGAPTLPQYLDGLWWRTTGNRSLADYGITNAAASVNYATVTGIVESASVTNGGAVAAAKAYADATFLSKKGGTVNSHLWVYGQLFASSFACNELTNLESVEISKHPYLIRFGSSTSPGRIEISPCSGGLRFKYAGTTESCLKVDDSDIATSNMVERVSTNVVKHALSGHTYDFANGSNFTLRVYIALTNVIQTLGGTVTNTPTFN